MYMYNVVSLWNGSLCMLVVYTLKANHLIHLIH